MRTIRLRIVAPRANAGLAPSRERARALILAGQVTVDGKVVSKAGTPVGGRRADRRSSRPIIPTSAAAASSWRTRSTRFDIEVDGPEALDVGASTGGFTDVLLQRGATRVIALDVGHGQLDWRLRTDPRVIVREGMSTRGR